MEIKSKHRAIAKTFDQLTTDEKRKLGIIYRNLAHNGFKKSILSINNYILIHDVLNLKLHLRDNGFLYPSEYIQVMQGIYDIYGWGEYDDEDEYLWLRNRIKSQDFINMLNNCYAYATRYECLVGLIRLYKDKFNLKIKVEEL